jgi:hypothetical protein
MEFHEALFSHLPSPLDDEPQGLRQDIIDELADHLACSAQRELLRGTDRATARARILEQFGDPAAVARRLYLDAMRGKLMAKRVVIGTCVFVTAASLLLVGLLWRQLLQVQRVAALQAAETAQLLADHGQKAQAREEEVLRQLREMSESVQKTRTMDLNPVSFQLNGGRPNGPLERDYKVWFGPITERPYEANFQRCGPSGVADLFPVAPGNYHFQVSKEWKNGKWIGTSVERLAISPGSQTVKRLVCPEVPPQKAEVRFRYSLPEDLKKAGLVLFARFDGAYRSVDAGVEWQLFDYWPAPPEAIESTKQPRFQIDSSPAIRRVILESSSTTIGIAAGKSLYLWGEKNDRRHLGADHREASADILEADLQPAKQPAGTLSWEVGEYHLALLVLIRPSRTADGDATRRRYNLFAGTNGSGYDLGVTFNSGLPKWPPTTRALTAERPASDDKLDVLLSFGVREENRDKRSNRYDVRPGEVNEWMIPVPDVLIQRAREQLKTESRPEID